MTAVDDKSAFRPHPWALVGASLWLSATLAGGCVACSDGGATDESPDGGASTTTTFTHPTSSTTSTSADGGPWPPFEGWSHLDGVPDTCDAYVPDSLSQVAPLVWESCQDATPGCRDLVINWVGQDGRAFYSNFAGAAVEPTPVVVVGREFGEELSDWFEMVVGRVDGNVLTAVRGLSEGASRYCTGSRAAVDSDRVIAKIADGETGPSYAEYEFEIPIHTGIPRVFNTLTPEILHGNWSGLRSAGPMFAAVSLDPSSEILKVPYDHSAPTTIAKFSTAHPWRPDVPRVMGSDILFWASFEGRLRAYVYHDATGETESYLDEPGYDIVGLWTDGTTVAWIRSAPPYQQNDTPTTVELWISPYSSSPSALMPEKVVDLTPSLRHANHHFESGLVVLRDSMWIPGSPDVSYSRHYVLRLSDRMVWTLDAPDGMWWGETMYAAPDEVAMPIQPPYNQPETSTVRRQQLSALAPPEPLGAILGTQ